MKERTRVLLLELFLVALIVTSLGVAFTYGRFSEEMPSTGGSYESDIEYIVSNEIEVSNHIEFIQAIENGYTNIIISDHADESLVITAGVTDVGVDLILNLNGHQIIRNSREPILNVENGVRLTIIDTSEGKNGSFYNPVGSVLQISGGTLTVSDGVFESGPRKEEYHSSGDPAKHGTLSDPVTTTVYIKNTDNTAYVAETESRVMPTIAPGTSSAGLTNGNIYLDTGYASDYMTDDYDNEYITADTYLYYVAEGQEIEAIAADPGRADFYYTYPDGEGQEITVYGYNNVKGSSVGDANYAAVSMQSGNMYVRGGEFRSYFGQSSTYGVYAEGGYMSVEGGSFSSIEAGVCIRCNYTAISATEYLRITSGNFRSEWGDTVQVDGGRLALSGGSFEKDASTVPSESGLTAGGAIRVTSGELDGAGASDLHFSLKGSDLYGIYIDGGEAVLNDAEFAFGENTQNNTGIYALSGSVEASDCVFTLPSASSYGIFSTGDDVNNRIVANGCVFRMTGEESTGVSAHSGTITLGGTSANPYSLFYIEYVRNCYGVLADNSGTGSAAGGITVNVDSAQFFMGQSHPADGNGNDFNGAGIYLNATDSVVNVKDGLFITAGRGCSGVYAKQGSVRQTGTDSKLVVVTGAVYTEYREGGKDQNNEWIYFPRKGSDYVAGVALAVETSKTQYSYGIFTTAGTVSLDSAYIAVYSDQACGVRTGEAVQGGAAGGSVTATTLDIDVRTSGNTAGSTGKVTLSTTAISTQNGDVTLGTANINTDALGITAQGGNVSVNTGLTLISTRATAIYVNGGSLQIAGGTADSPITITSQIDANCVWGASGATEPYSYDGIYVHGGSFVSSGTLNLTHTGIQNDDQYESNYWQNNANTLYRDFVIKSYAVRVESSATADSTVRILDKAIITNSVGGGVYVGVSDDAGGTGGRKVTVQLGAADSTDYPSIETTGTTTYGTSVSISGADSNWAYRQSRTGGHAVEVAGGTLTIYGGMYSAAMGNGILVKDGTANVYGGNFSGNDSYGTVAGVAASYAFKLYGGTANIYSGTFGAGSLGSGAFVMGNSADDMGHANIYGGSFVVNGQAGFSVYKYANILFAPRGGENGQGDDITVSGNAAGIAVETTQAIEGKNCAVRIEIKGGDFRSTGSGGGYDGIWYSNPNAELIISGGTFTGSARSGLWFQQTPNTGKVSLSGGTYVRAGGNSPIGGSYSESAVLASGCTIDKSNGNSWTIS